MISFSDELDFDSIMGAFLDKPKTEKHNECGGANGIRYGVSSMQVSALFQLASCEQFLVRSSVEKNVILYLCKCNAILEGETSINVFHEYDEI